MSSGPVSADHEVHISVTVTNRNDGSRFSIIEAYSQRIATFAALDELMTRMRQAVHPDE